MIKLGPSAAALPPLERFALETLLDLSCILRTDDPSADVVELEVHDIRSSCSLADAVANRWFISAVGTRTVVERASLRLIGELAGAVAEQRSEAHDRHERVPSAQNALVAAEAERDPVVSRAAVVLRDTAMLVAGARAFHTLAPWPDGHRWAAALTHDLDVVEWWPVFTGLRLVELARAGEWRDLIRVKAAAVRSLFGNPVEDGVRRVLAIEAEARARSTWFVLCGSPTLRTFAQGDLTFRPEAPATRRILAAARDGGHEIGLHGSFATMESAAEFRAQRDRLARTAKAQVTGVRQHFLRMRPGRTQRAMEDAGLAYDGTFGYPDRNGFRLGVADVVAAWDEQAQCETTLQQVPLAWMDRALSKYQGVMEPDRWIDDALALAATVQEVNGLWVGLWHPNLITPLGFPRAIEAYARLVRELRARGAWIAPAGEIVAWRTARRAVRAAAVNGDGSVHLQGGAGALRFAIETHQAAQTPR